jgi:hypothetical protein
MSVAPAAVTDGTAEDRARAMIRRRATAARSGKETIQGAEKDELGEMEANRGRGFDLAFKAGEFLLHESRGDPRVASDLVCAPAPFEPVEPGVRAAFSIGHVTLPI